MLPDNFLSLLQQSMQLIGIVITAIASSFFFLIPLAPALVLLGYLQWIFRKASTQLKRLESTTFSPVYSSLAAAARGAESIRAYGLSEDFSERHRALTDAYIKIYIVYQLVQRWLAFRLDCVCAALIVLVGVICVLAGSAVSANVAGLAIVYVMQLMGLLQWTVRVYIIVEGSMTSVERLNAYAKLPAEALYRTPEAVLADFDRIRLGTDKGIVPESLAGAGPQRSSGGGLVRGRSPSKGIAGSSFGAAASNHSPLIELKASSSDDDVASGDAASTAEGSLSSVEAHLRERERRVGDEHVDETRPQLLRRLRNWPWHGAVQFEVRHACNLFLLHSFALNLHTRWVCRCSTFPPFPPRSHFPLPAERCYVVPAGAPDCPERPLLHHPRGQEGWCGGPHGQWQVLAAARPLPHGRDSRGPRAHRRGGHALAWPRRPPLAHVYHSAAARAVWRHCALQP